MVIFLVSLGFSRLQDTGWKGWGEISYGGCESMQRAKAAEFLVNDFCLRSAISLNQYTLFTNFSYVD